MSITSESNTVDNITTTERTDVQDSRTSDQDSVNKEYKTDINTQTIGQVSQTY